MVAALSKTASLDAPSELSDWSLLTVACHLRYGARASRRMSAECLDGLATSFYPLGRSSQRPSTLHPDPGEHRSEVVISLEEESARLHKLWAGLSISDWETEIEEPEDNRDLGRTTIADLALLCLTEVEVHGGDLGLGLRDWSNVFVRSALPGRVAWLATRRSNHRAVDRDVQGSWLLVGDDGARWRVSVDGDRVSSGAADDGTGADCEIHGSSRDLLATLLGRPTSRSLSLRGDVGLAQRFSSAFPGP